MRTRTIYIARDDAEFPTEDECLAYEAAHPEFLLVGLTLSQLAAALAGENKEIADAVLLFASKLPAETPFHQGWRAYEDGVGGIIPTPFAKDKLAGQEWLRGWGHGADLRAGKAAA